MSLLPHTLRQFAAGVLAFVAAAAVAGPAMADTAAAPNSPTNVTVGQTTQTVAVTGLTNGTAYTFTVAATNPVGTGPPSEPSAPVVPALPVPTTLILTTSATSTSATASVKVGVGLTARLNRTSIALGRTATIGGQVVPAHAGQPIRLQQKHGRTWRNIQTRSLPGNGRFSFGLRPRDTGTTWWRIYKANDANHTGAASAPLRLVAYRASIIAIHADATGDDRHNLNGEYVLVRNTGAAAINLAGWKLDAGDPSQRFPLAGYGLRPGATVRIHTGHGATGAGRLYLGLGRPIWNNHGDTGTLIDPHNVAVSRHHY